MYALAGEVLTYPVHSVWILSVAQLVDLWLVGIVPSTEKMFFPIGNAWPYRLRSYEWSSAWRAPGYVWLFTKLSIVQLIDLWLSGGIFVTSKMSALSENV